MIRVLLVCIALSFLHSVAQGQDCDKRIKRTTVVKVDGADYVALALPCAALTLKWSRAYHVAVTELELAGQTSEAQERQILTLARQVETQREVIETQPLIISEERRGRQAAEKQLRRSKLTYGLTFFVVGALAGALTAALVVR